MRIVVQVARESFRTPEAFARWVQKELRLIAELNCELIHNRIVPPLSRSRVRYVREPLGQETFVDAKTCNDAGGGDCAHLGAWCLGELWLAGETAADINVIWFPPNSSGGRTYHVRVRRADGSIKDPSKERGM
jgi:hypothetical protein